MMNELEINDYIVAARETLNDDPDYNRWFSVLVEEQKALSEQGCCFLYGISGLATL